MQTSKLCSDCKLGPSLQVLTGVQVRESLTLRAKEFNILVDDVAITHLSFGTEVRQS